MPRESPNEPPDELFDFLGLSVNAFWRSGILSPIRAKDPFRRRAGWRLSPYSGQDPPLRYRNSIRDLDEVGGSGATRPSLRLMTCRSILQIRMLAGTHKSCQISSQKTVSQASEYGEFKAVDQKCRVITDRWPGRKITRTLKKKLAFFFRIR